VPAGITLIDTMDWSSRTLDHETTGVSYTGLGDVVLAWGSIWNATTQKSVGFGLSGYSSAGSRLFHLFGTEAVAVAAVAGTYAYVSSNSVTHYEIVDTTKGKIIGSVDTAQPTTLAATRPNF
jgi:hypothetical protein